MWDSITELKQLSSFLQWLSIALVFFSGFLQVGKYIVDKRERNLSAIEQAEKLNPIAQIIHTGSAVVEMLVSTDQKFSNHFMDSGAYAALCQGSEPLMTMASGDSFAVQNGEGEVKWRALISLDLADKSIGKPVRHLRDAEYVQLAFGQLPDGSIIKSGSLVVTLNSAVRLELAIPPQKVAEKRFFIRDLSPLKKALP
jgi:hypothetical protein